MNILVTGVGSTLGYGILETIRLSGLDCTVSGADYLKTAVGLYKVDFPFILPDIITNKVSEEEWLNSLIHIIDRQNIDYVLIGLDSEVPLFAKYKKRIEKNSSCAVVVSSTEVVKICNDKWFTYCFLKDQNLGAPKSCLSDGVESFRSKVPFPWIVKPRQGSTSKGLFRVNNSKDLVHALNNCDNLIIQEEVGNYNAEYTCGVVLADGKVLSSIALRRTLKNGNTAVAYYADSPEIDIYIRAVAEKLGAFGAINIQLRLTETGPKIFEINPRFSGTTPVRACFGLNEITVLFNYFSGRNLNNNFAIKEGMVVRHTVDHFVSDMDANKVVVL